MALTLTSVRGPAAARSRSRGSTVTSIRSTSHGLNLSQIRQSRSRLSNRRSPSPALSFSLDVYTLSPATTPLQPGAVPGDNLERSIGLNEEVSVAAARFEIRKECRSRFALHQSAPVLTYRHLQELRTTILRRSQERTMGATGIEPMTSTVSR